MNLIITKILVNFLLKLSKKNFLFSLQSIFFSSSSRLLTDGQSKLKEDTLTEKCLPSLRHLINYICNQCDGKIARNYTQQQLNDIQNELKRIRCIINYHILNEKIPQSLKTLQKTRFDQIRMLINKSGAFINNDYEQFKDAVENIISRTVLLKSSNVISEQTLSILDIFKMKSGQWFACQDNHVYNIDQVKKSSLIKDKSTRDRSYHILITHLHFRQRLVYSIVNAQRAH